MKTTISAVPSWRVSHQRKRGAKIDYGMTVIVARDIVSGLTSFMQNRNAMGVPRDSTITGISRDGNIWAEYQAGLYDVVPSSLI